MTWQTKILSATRPKSNRPQSNQRRHPSRKTPHPPAARPKRTNPAVWQRAEPPAARRRASLRSRQSRLIRARGMKPRPRLGRLRSRRDPPALLSRAADPVIRSPRIRVPDLRQVAIHSATPLTKVTPPTASASSTRRQPTRFRAAGVASLVRAAEHPAVMRVQDAAAGTAAGMRRVNQAHDLPAASRAASRTGRPAEAHPAEEAHPAVATLRGRQVHQAARTGPAATASHAVSSLHQGRTADPSTAQPPQSPDLARQWRVRGLPVRLRSSRKS